MKQIQEPQQTVTCNECGSHVRPIGENPVGRFVYRCPECEYRQVGPFP